MNIEYNKHLLAYNTFGIDSVAEEFAQIQSEDELMEALHYANKNQTALHIIGGGSNILFVHDIKGLVLRNQLKGMQIVYEDKHVVHVKCMSGEVWHECVLWSVAKNYGGIENLSLIPGTIGAAPIQNIGAYGVELKDVFVELEAIHVHTLEKKIFTHQECAFAYRDSIFKTKEKGNYFILSVTLALSKDPICKTTYGTITKELEAMRVGLCSIKLVSEAVIRIRTSKLPNPAEIGNAGSFFKNPGITLTQYEELKMQYEDMPAYDTAKGKKIPAAWLIEMCGWKGYRENDFGVHKKQALVLVNYDHAKGSDILMLSEKIIASVQEKFSIQLEREVNVW
jgi:UDP-N-acetylmuramate dehydrogenase